MFSRLLNKTVDIIGQTSGFNKSGTLFFKIKKYYPIISKSNLGLPIPDDIKKITPGLVLAVVHNFTFCFIVSLYFFNKRHIIVARLFFYHKQSRLQRNDKPSCKLFHGLFYPLLKITLMLYNFFPSGDQTDFSQMMSPENRDCHNFL